MKFWVLIFLFTASCGLEKQGFFGNVCSPTEKERMTAQSYYDSFGTMQADISEKEARQAFGACYKNWDKVYSYNTFWGEKLILVRYGEAVTFVERKKNAVKQSKAPALRQGYGYYR
jgi:hypothetical protein